MTANANTNPNWALRVAAEYAVIAAAFYMASLSVWMVYPAILVVGTRQHALGVIGHWAMHGLTPHPKATMWLCFAPLAIDPRVYEASHRLHHKYLGDPTRDPEVEWQTTHSKGWKQHRTIDLVTDAVGVNTDEAITILRMLVSLKSLIVYATLVGILASLIGWLALLWPASLPGLMLAHRLRARAEHDHINRPGFTHRHNQPALWMRILYLPHYAWLHKEHHDDPRQRVWIG